MATLVTLSDCKAHIRKTTTDEDNILTIHRANAIKWVEEYTSHILSSRSITETYDAWGDYLTLNKRPVTAIVEVGYTDAAGEDAVYEDGVLWTAKHPARIYPASQFPTLGTNGTITAEYTAGYAADEMPEEANWAILILFADMFDNRGKVSEEAADAVRFILRFMRGVVMA